MTVQQNEDQLPEPVEGQDSTAPSSLTINDPLEELFLEAQLNRRTKRTPKGTDPSLRNALDAAAKKMRELYTLPENWERKRGIALIDRETQTLVGNFSEYVHRSIPNTRKLLREHTPIPIDATEQVSGYLGEALECRLRGKTWEQMRRIAADLWLDELMVGAPKVQIEVKTKLGVLVRVDLCDAVQFASASGNTIMSLPAGTNVLEHLSTDTKAWVRKQT